MKKHNEEKHSKEKRPRTLKERVATGCVIGALVVAAAAAVFFIQKKDSLVLKGAFTVSLMGTEQEYYGKVKLAYDKKTKEVTLHNDSRSLPLLGVPVYRKEGESASVVLSRSMIYTNYRTEVISRVNHFGRLSYEGQIGKISTDGKKRKEVNGGYLFDGKDIYLFLEPMTLSWGEESMELSPLSFVSVSNKQGFYYYDCEKQESGYISSGEAVVTAADSQESYELNMSNDIAALPDGKTLLLPPNPESFELFQ